MGDQLVLRFACSVYASLSLGWWCTMVVVRGSKVCVFHKKTSLPVSTNQRFETMASRAHYITLHYNTLHLNNGQSGTLLRLLVRRLTDPLSSHSFMSQIKSLCIVMMMMILDFDHQTMQMQIIDLPPLSSQLYGHKSYCRQM